MRDQAGGTERVERGGPADTLRADVWQRVRDYRGGVIALEIDDIVELLPQRQPFIFVDRVVSLIPGAHAVATKGVTGNEAGLSARKFGFVFPSTFVLEALVQLATVVVRAQDARAIDELWLLQELDRFDVSQEMTGADMIYLHVAVGDLAPGRVTVHGRAELAGQDYVTTDFVLARQAL